MITPLVSVVLCTYNDEKYIAKTIKSVLTQTFTDYEFIIWNDGSSDKTEEIVKSFSDDRIRYFDHENTGLGIALSLACKEARGKYIARIDGDDICLPNRFQKEVDFLENHRNYVIVSSSVFYINENDEVIGRSFHLTWNSCLRKRRTVAHPAVMFRNDAYKKTCGYLGLSSAQDRILWSKMVQFGKIKNFMHPLINYRMISSSISHSFDTNGEYAKMLDVIRTKMSKDDIVDPEDINLHNIIYAKAKKERKKGSSFCYLISPEERLLKILTPFMGYNIAERVVFLLKNAYMYFILKAWK